MDRVTKTSLIPKIRGKDVTCAGWDGIERRCACGNRRVDWEWDGELLWAEAY